MSELLLCYAERGDGTVVQPGEVVSECSRLIRAEVCGFWERVSGAVLPSQMRASMERIMELDAVHLALTGERVLTLPEVYTLAHWWDA